MEAGGRRRRPSSRVLVIFFFLSSAAFPVCFSDFPTIWKRSAQPPTSVVLPLSGNVYPLAYYSVSLKVGQPPKAYNLDIDTGSDLTWLQCDAPCTGCTLPRDQLYKPNKNIVRCEDPLCSSMTLSLLQSRETERCINPHDQCDYEIEYADNGSSLGVLISDQFALPLTNGTILSPHLTFGCGYNQLYPGPNAPPPTAGVLGLRNAKVSIISQLHGKGMIRNVLGHCLSTRGGGFLFFGDVSPSSRISWVPMSCNLEQHYSAGPAQLLFNGKPTGVKGLTVIFDSGSSYTYFNSKAYQVILNQLKGVTLKGAQDDSLPVCWKSSKPFKSLNEVKAYFKPLVLSFAKNVQFPIPPEAYLVVTKYGNACLGILNGTQVGLGEQNVIGDISSLDKMVIFDNEKKQIGWASASCERLPKGDPDHHNEGISLPHDANYHYHEEL